MFKAPKYTIENYHREQPLDSFLHPKDSIFSSPKGIFISRGCHSKHNPSTISSILNDINNFETRYTKPFIVFSLDFNPETDQQVILPNEMIHIDPNNWVTHYYIDSKQFLDSNDLIHPNHIEMMSPESKDQFIDKVTQILKHIDVGDVEKVVLARRLNVISDNNIDIRLLFMELLDSQPNSFVYTSDNFVGASPELLIEKNSSVLKSMPMAGTRKRHARIDDDDADIADLISNIKDSNEHRLVVNDIISSLSKVASHVTSHDSPHVVRLPHVSHLATSISAIAPDHSDLMTFVSKIHPTPAVAGSPTSRALEIIEDSEGFNRMKYAGPIGWIDSNGDGQCAIALRCAHINDNMAQLFAGVGIVSGSDPEKEWEETQAKFGVMRDALMNITQ